MSDADDIALAQLLRRREARARAVANHLRRHVRPASVVIDGQRIDLPIVGPLPAEVYADLAEWCAEVAQVVEARLPASHRRRCSATATAIARSSTLTVDEAMRLVAMYGSGLSADRAVALAAEVPEEDQ